MGIDPRTIKELLQLQIWNSVSMLNRGGDTDDKDNVFGDLLNDLLQQADAGDGAEKREAALKPSALHPFALSGLNPSSRASGSAAAGMTDYDSLIAEASGRFGVDSSLVKAVIDAESSFNPRAVSSAGAKGLMQLMDATGQGLGVTDPFDPQQNIEGGTRYLSRLLSRYDGNEATALAAYNAGSGRLARLGISNDAELEQKLHLLPQETQKYVRKVLNLKSNYEA